MDQKSHDTRDTALLQGRKGGRKSYLRVVVILAESAFRLFTLSCRRSGWCSSSLYSTEKLLPTVLKP